MSSHFLLARAVYRKRGKVRWAKLSRFWRGPRKFFCDCFTWAGLYTSGQWTVKIFPRNTSQLLKYCRKYKDVHSTLSNNTIKCNFVIIFMYVYCNYYKHNYKCLCFDVNNSHWSKCNWLDFRKLITQVIWCISKRVCMRMHFQNVSWIFSNTVYIPGLQLWIPCSIINYLGMLIASAGHVAVLHPTNYKCMVWNGFPKSSQFYFSWHLY